MGNIGPLTQPEIPLGPVMGLAHTSKRPVCLSLWRTA